MRFLLLRCRLNSWYYAVCGRIDLGVTPLVHVSSLLLALPVHPLELNTMMSVESEQKLTMTVVSNTSTQEGCFISGPDDP